MTRKRPSANEHHQVPPFFIEEAAAPGWIAVTCGRKKCAQTFYVKRAYFLHGPMRRFVARSCPYCFKVSRVITGDDDQ